MAKDKERDFRLRPRKPVARSERATWASAYKIIVHHARTTSSRLRRSVGQGSGPNRIRPYSQRCAVRVMYAKNATSGQWRAHGRYVARESAAQDGDSKAVGFDSREESINIAARLEGWRKAGDERLWKLIVSPEFGDRADMKRLTRDLVSRTEKDLGTQVEWVAAAHYNTEHPHVHVSLRGIGAKGRSLHLSRDYIRQGIRCAAEDLCTRQLGYRTEFDAAIAQRREVHEHRYASLDRAIKRDAVGPGNVASTFFTVVRDPNQDWVNRNARLMQQHTTERLIALEGLGLAEHADPNLWRVRGDFEDVLRAMQRSADRQKMLAAHGVLMSDERLPLVVLDLRSLTILEGRILVHGEEETGRQSGRSYLMLEGTDGRVHYVYYTPEMEAARNRGGLRANSFIRADGLVQGYNAQAAVEPTLLLIVGQGLTQAANDKQQLQPMVEAITQQAQQRPAAILADSGYCSQENLQYLESDDAPKNKIDGYVATGKSKHGQHRQPCPRGPLPKGATRTAKMKRKLQTKVGKAVYAARKTIVEPVFGQIKQARGFRRFLLRGFEKVAGEWALVCLTHNILRLYAICNE